MGSGTGQAVELVWPASRKHSHQGLWEQREGRLTLPGSSQEGFPEVTLGLRPEGELTVLERAKTDVAQSKNSRTRRGSEKLGSGERGKAEPRAQGGTREMKGAGVALGLRWLVAGCGAEASPWWHRKDLEGTWVEALRKSLDLRGGGCGVNLLCRCPRP